MATLTAGIDADQTTIAISGDVSAAVTGGYYSLEDEIIQLRAFAPRDEPHYRAPRGPDDRQRWIVTRGVDGSTANPAEAGSLWNGRRHAESERGMTDKSLTPMKATWRR